MDYVVAEGVTNQAVFEARNVIKKRASFHVSQMQNELDTFMTAIEKAGGHPNGPIVYSLNNVPEDGNMDVEFLLPLQEEYLK